MGRIRLRTSPVTVVVVLAMTICPGLWLADAEEADGQHDEVSGADTVHPHAGKLKSPDGSWKYTNRLVHESSPYLLLHAHNPVDWYPWGTEALERARDEDKPIFLSVGYSSCYWCHVMERLVFSDPEIAKLMNQWFVNIKVDREERPDLDEIYMTATQLVTGRGGWPNSVFLTSGLKPFFAGTYFPPDDSLGRPGFPRILEALHEAWKNRRGEVEDQGNQITGRIRHIQQGQVAASGQGDLTRELVETAVQHLAGQYEEEYGGFGRTPKFPPSQDLELLMAEYERTGEDRLIGMVTQTLEMMARGGMHDHLGGGFHRYSTDSKWRVPHFEKMLYNQAQLSKVYLRAYVLTGEVRFRTTAEGILRFVSDTMTSPEGAFYSALDAETEGIEGKHYLWTEDEIRVTLGEGANLFLTGHALASSPEEGAGAIYVRHSLQQYADSLKMSQKSLLKRIGPMKGALLKTRNDRPFPLLDTKVITAWNGLMIDAYAYAYEVLRKPEYLQASRKAADYILGRLTADKGGLRRTYSGGRAKYDGYQEDYAFLVRGLLGLHRASGEKRYLDRAADLADEMIERFWDEKDGGFYLADEKDDLIVRTKSPYDRAVPSGNSVAAHVLVELARETGRTGFLQIARRTMRAFAGAASQNPGPFKHMIMAVHRYLEQRGQPDLADVSRGKAGHTASSPVPRGGDLVRAEAEVSADRLIPGEAFDITVRLVIAEGWHVNANPASEEFLVPTTLEVDSGLEVQIGSVDYPEGEHLDLSFAGGSVAVYTGETTVRAKLRLGASARPGATGLLRLKIHYQACDDQQCLLPETLELTRRIEVADVAHPAARPAP